jgi:hypothetical protein
MAAGAIAASRRARTERERERIRSNANKSGLGSSSTSIGRAEEAQLRLTWSSPKFADAVRSTAAPESDPLEQATLRIGVCAGGGEGSNGLNLAMLGLEEVPSSVFELTALQHLDLSGNRLPQLPGALPLLKALLTLSMEHVGLQRLGDDLMEGLTQLESLNLRNNDLSELPDGLFSLTSLKSLDLGGNQLTTLPPEVEQLRALEDLRLDHNNLGGTLPTTLYSLVQLHNLCLQGNRFTQIPAGISALRALNNLELAGNQLTELPVEVAHMKELLHIDVASNPIRVPPPEICEQSALAIRGFLEDLETGSELCTSLDIFFLGAKDGSILKLLRDDQPTMDPPPTAGDPSPPDGDDDGAVAVAAVAAARERVQGECDGGSRMEPPASAVGVSRDRVVRSIWELGPAAAMLSSCGGQAHVEGGGGVQARMWCFPSDQPVLHLTHQILFHRRCLFLVAIELGVYSVDAHDVMVQRWVRDLRTRVPGAVILFVATRHTSGGMSSAEEQRICDSIAARVMQAEGERQEGLRRHLEQLRHIIDTKEAIRKSNPGQSTRQRGWRAMKTLVGTAAKRNEELCTRIAQQLEAAPVFLREGRPICVNLRTGEGADSLRSAVLGVLPYFPHVGAPVPARYAQLQRLFEQQQIEAAKLNPVAGQGSMSSKLAIYWNDFKVLAGRVGISGGPDPVRRAARYLTLMGAIVHVSDDAALKPFVFVDPPRLCEVFAGMSQVADSAPQADAEDDGDENATAIKEGLKKLRRTGALNPTVRRWLGAKLSLDEHTSQLVFSMMSRIGLHAERPAESEATASRASGGLLSALTALTTTDVMVPSLLPEKPSPGLAALWGGTWASSWPADPDRPQLNMQLRRVYTLQETSTGAHFGLPLGLLGCVLSRLMQRVAAEPVEMWRDGACMAVHHELGVPGARVLAERSVNGGVEVNGAQQSVLSLTVRTSTQMLVDGCVAALWGRLDDCVRSALEQQPGCVLGAYIACPLCQAKNVAPYLFTATEVVEAWRDGALNMLSPGLSRVPMEMLQPPTIAEATDADRQNNRTDDAKQKANREFRQSQMNGLLSSFLQEGPDFQNASLGASKLSEEPMLNLDQRIALEDRRSELRTKKATRMGIYGKDCKEMVLSGDGKALGEYQSLIPVLLR